MLTALPPRLREDERALLQVAHWWQRLEFDWDRFALRSCVAFHLIVAGVLAFAPTQVVLTEGTSPVLDLADRHVWALVFAAVAVAVAVLGRHPARLIRIPVWVAVLFLGGMWLSAFGWAVFRGEGSAIGVAVWPFLYGPWAFVAARLSLGKR